MFTDGECVPVLQRELLPERHGALGGLGEVCKGAVVFFDLFMLGGGAVGIERDREEGVARTDHHRIDVGQHGRQDRRDARQGQHQHEEQGGGPAFVVVEELAETHFDLLALC